MTKEEMRAATAEICKFDLWVIVKRGLYYRPGASGYTASIAEAWKLPKEEAKRYEMYADRADIDNCEKVTIEPAPSPDYPGDLNAMHSAEQTLSREQWVAYGYALWDVVKPDPNFNPFTWYCANAEQRDEAFLRIHGKWKEAV